MRQLVILLLLISPSAICADLTWQKTDHTVALLRGGHIVWQHNHEPNMGKPYFHPLATVKGTVLTELRPADHVWHRAGWWSWKFINGLNYWEENKQTHRSQGHTDITSARVITGPDHTASIELVLSYHPPEKPEVLSEQRTIHVSAPDASGNYYLDWSTTFTAKMDAQLERTPLPGQPGGKGYGGYAGLSLRAARKHRHWTFLDSEGRTKNGHGKTARRVSHHGKTSTGESASLVIMDHPQNPGAPTKWYLSKGMPYFSPAVIFDGGRKLAKGESLSYRYRILVQSKQTTPEILEKIYREFSEADAPRSKTATPGATPPAPSKPNQR